LDGIRESHYYSSLAYGQEQIKLAHFKTLLSSALSLYIFNELPM